MLFSMYVLGPKLIHLWGPIVCTYNSGLTIAWFLYIHGFYWNFAESSGTFCRRTKFLEKREGLCKISRFKKCKSDFNLLFILVALFCIDRYELYYVYVLIRIATIMFCIQNLNFLYAVAFLNLYIAQNANEIFISIPC